MNKCILFTLITNSHATGKLPITGLSFMLQTCYGETGVMDLASVMDAII